MHKIHNPSLISTTFALIALFFLYANVSSQTTTTPVIAVEATEIVSNQPITVPITLENFDQTGLGSVMFTVSYDISAFASASCATDPEGLFQLNDCAIHPSEDGTRSEALFTLINGQNILTDMATILGSIVFTATDQVDSVVALEIEAHEFADLGGNFVAFEAMNGLVAIAPPSNGLSEGGEALNIEYKIYLPVINR